MNPAVRLTAVLLAFLLSPAGHAGQQTAAAEGSFGFRASVEGELFEARFSEFAVVPRLGADRRPTGFAVEIGLTGIDSGNADRDAEMQSAEWFDTAAYPVATFHAHEVEVGSTGGYIARGDLQVKGMVRTIQVPFSWQIGPRRMRLIGEVSLDRRWFKIGPEDDSLVAVTVTVFFDLAWADDGN